MVTTLNQATDTPQPGAGRTRRVFSGIQPTGNFHLGNYLGAIRNWVQQQDQYDNTFCVVDLHSIYQPTTREGMRENIRNLASVIIASGIDPSRSTLFVQSDVAAHSELAWILQSVTQFGELRRMTQFKDKGGGSDEAVNAAIFNYPVLMAADILLYDTDLVPVGDDQKQHLELARDVATRFNARFGETFVVPKPDIKPEGARIMALDDPTKKMSKSSSNVNSYIALTDPPGVMSKKIKRAVTDSGADIVVDPAKPALSNLISIYALLENIAPQEVEDRFTGKGYGAFKGELAEVVVNALEPIQQRLAEIESDPGYIHSVLTEGAATASAYANQTMGRVKDRMGLGG